MPKLYSSDEIIKILLQNGFVFISQKGSHKKYRKTGTPTLTVIVPADRKQIPFGTFNLSSDNQDCKLMSSKNNYHVFSHNNHHTTQSYLGKYKSKP